MKKYNELLEEYIRSSGLKLVDISEKLKDLGIPTDRSYLSKLRSGKVPPASDEINKAIATIVNRDPDELLLSAYLEKAPEKLLNLLDDFNMLETEITIDIEDALNTERPTARYNPEIYKDLLTRGINPYDQKNFSHQLSSMLSVYEKWNIFKKLFNSNSIFSEPIKFEIAKPPSFLDALSIRDVFNHMKAEKNNDSHETGYREIPFITKIFHGGQLHMEDFVGSIKCDLDHFKFKDKDDVFFTSCYDKGLSEIDIQPEDIILVEVTDIINPQDICLITVGSSPSILRKVKQFESYFLLQPLNNQMEIEIVNLTDVQIVGKALEVRKIRQL